MLKHIQWLALICFCLANQSIRAEVSAVRKPNIIFFLADDLGYGEVGCYGQKKILTPNIDRLAKEGMRFTQFYSGSHVCAPSRSTLMTGLHTGHTPVRANGGFINLDQDDVTVAEVLKKAGYVNGGFGKWGLGTETSDGSPTQQGFDKFFGFLHQVHAHFHFPFWLWNNEKKFFLPENEGKKQVRYAPDVIHNEALNFIRENKDKSFFCYIPTTLPHVELIVPEDSMKPYHGKWTETPLKDPRAGYLGSDEPYATFAAMVSRTDRYVGEVMALVKKLNIDDNTIIFFSGDNGPQGNQWKRIADFFNGNGGLRGYKGEFYEGGIRVPLIARWPGKIAPNTTSTRISAFWDFLPTAAEIAGAELPKNIDGISLLPTLVGKAKQQEHEFLYWEMPHGEKQETAVRMGDWKAISPKSGAPLELYNLTKDLAETTNVAAENSTVLKRIQEIVTTAHTPQRKYTEEKVRTGVKDYVR